MKKITVLICLFVSSILLAFQPNPKLTLPLVPNDAGFTIDGELDESWNLAKAFNNFTEYQPNENKAPDVETHGYISFDEENLYVAFVCIDPDIDNIRATLTDRDNILNDDYVAVSIDPNRDHQRAFQFFANAQGIQADRLWRMNGDAQDFSYDVVWECDAQIYDDRWTVEMKIPFESLRFPDQDDQVWSVHFTRSYPRENPFMYSWMPITQNNNSFMGQAGQISFTIPKREFSKNNLEVLPYVISNQQGNRITDQSDANFGGWNSENPTARAGFGVKYGLTSSVVADFTYNPDFSQIESDAGQISINSPFALFYREMRPFFQEGSEIYTVDHFVPGIMLDQYVNLFYSRSINNPLVAGKISGKMGKFDIGYTTALDENTPFIIPFEESSAVVPSNQRSISNVLRAKYDLGNQSSIGFFTSNRQLETDGANTVGAVDASFRLSEKYRLTAIAAITHTQEPVDSTLSLRIGARNFEINDDIKTGAFDGEKFTGSLLRLKMARESRHLTASLAYQDFSPGFRADNGFIMTTGYRNVEGSTAYAFRWDDHKLFTAIVPRVSAWRKYNYDNLVKDTGIVPSVRINFHKQISWSVGGFLFNQENLRGKQFGHARQIWTFMTTNSSRKISTGTYIRVGKEINRMGVIGDAKNPFEIVPSLTFNHGITWQPTTKLNNDLQFRLFQLWQKFGKDQIMEQQIIRNTLRYQFSKNFSVRLITEYNVMDYLNPYSGLTINDKNLSFEPLVSYKLNAFSVFYVGAHFGGNNNVYLDWNDIRLHDQSVYMKLQYLFGL